MPDNNDIFKQGLESKNAAQVKERDDFDRFTVMEETVQADLSADEITAADQNFIPEDPLASGNVYSSGRSLGVEQSIASSGILLNKNIIEARVLDNAALLELETSTGGRSSKTIQSSLTEDVVTAEAQDAENGAERIAVSDFQDVSNAYSFGVQTVSGLGVDGSGVSGDDANVDADAEGDASISETSSGLLASQGAVVEPVGNDVDTNTDNNVEDNGDTGGSGDDPTDDGNNGHGNDADGVDESNPGKSTGVAAHGHSTLVGESLDDSSDDNVDMDALFGDDGAKNWVSLIEEDSSIGDETMSHDALNDDVSLDGGDDIGISGGFDGSEISSGDDNGHV